MQNTFINSELMNLYHTECRCIMNTDYNTGCACDTLQSVYEII